MSRTFANKPFRAVRLLVSIGNFTQPEVAGALPESRVIKYELAARGNFCTIQYSKGRSYLLRYIFRRAKIAQSSLHAIRRQPKVKKAEDYLRKYVLSVARLSSMNFSHIKGIFIRFRFLV